MSQLYTVGCSNYPEGHFINLMKLFSVDYVLDVRSIPYSRHTPQYNREHIQEILDENSIDYTYMGRIFGARRSEPELYNAEGYVDFEKTRNSEIFKKGIENVILGLKSHTIALMCTEKDPINCHRAIMVARGFELAGVNVKHILHNNTTITQEELNERLIDIYFPDYQQLSIFTNENHSRNWYITEAYKLRNKLIGYRRDSNIEGADI